MIKKELHSHTTFCDGNNTPEEMVKAAIEKGFLTLGFSGHSYTFFDERYCMSKAGTRQYKEEIARLKEKYKSDIEILCGTEQDYYSDMPTEGYDYVIGSVHYMKAGDRYIPVDETPDILISAAKKHFGGDMIELCRCYYGTVADVVAKTGADIIDLYKICAHVSDLRGLELIDCIIVFSLEFSGYVDVFIILFIKLIDEIIKSLSVDTTHAMPECDFRLIAGCR